MARLPFMFNPVTITLKGCFEGDDFDISLELDDNGYLLRGKRIRRVLIERPRILRRTVRVSSDWAVELLNDLKNADIPLLPEEIYGCDGEFFTMTVGSDFGGATYKWWSDPPKGWESLPKITSRMIDEFSKHLPK